MAPRTKLAAAAGAVAAAALVLTACGGGGHDDKIASSPTPRTPATTATASATATDASAPAFDLPSDLKVNVDADTKGDATKDAILRDQAYGLKASFVASAKSDDGLPLFTTYVIADAAATWDDTIAALKQNHHAFTGTVHYYARSVTIGDSAAGVSFCEDQRYLYDKDTKTGKVLTTKPSDNSFIFHTSRMVRAKDGSWQTTTYTSQRGAAQCRR